ncbi:GAP family protein [Nocardia sp. XZ_19_369]|uniref:GAP family protein n=1 Tax=Nocardia sp. XZ_19_369 TaxID=2769487 RepID=UPI00188E8C47|nr:GAP family protein [Nocardia sp. XZ_19_369]
MTLPLVAALIGLALVDSTSFGTLLIPIWLLLTPGRLRPGRIAVYLATVAIFYFAVGVLLVLGADTALTAIRTGSLDIPEFPLRIAQLILGLLVIALSYWLEARAKRRAGQPGKIHRWRTKAMSGTGSPRSLMNLALAAAALEVATMLPYLAAIALIANADLPWSLTGLTLATYCILMTLPALALAAARLIAHHRIDPLLQKINNWLTKHSATAIGWAVGGIGIWLTLNAAATLLFNE